MFGTSFRTTDFKADGLGVAAAYSMHPLLCDYIIKFLSLALDD